MGYRSVSRDIWPILAKSITWGYGSTGTFGFQTPGVRDWYHNLGHSDYFVTGFAEEYWVPWIRNGVTKPTPYETGVRPPTPFFKNLLEIFPLKLVLLLLCVAALVCIIVSHAVAPEMEVKHRVRCIRLFSRRPIDMSIYVPKLRPTCSARGGLR